jgi:hypothetical protein
MFVIVGQRATVPTAPTISSSTVTTNSVTLTLAAASAEPIFGVLGYDIEMSLDAITYTRVATVVDMPYIVSGLLSGVTYRFRARGVDNTAGAYRSQPSNVVAITTTGGGPPPPGRRFFGGWYVAIAPSQQSGTPPGGIPNGGTVTGTYPNATVSGATVSNSGPVCSGVSCVVTRKNWSDMDNGDGTYNWVQTDKEMAQAKALGVALFIIVIVRTFDGNGTLGDGTNPMPADIAAYADPFIDSANPSLSGYQGYRWSPTVIARLQTFCNAMGARYDLDPTFAGIATQETATGNTTGHAISHGTGNYTVTLTNGLGNFTSSDVYSVSNFALALIMESRIIAAACPHARHLLYENFTNGDNSSATLGTVAVAVQPLGTIWCGPDMVTDAEPGNINTRCYPNYTHYHNGTNGVPAPGLTACAIQAAEWTGKSPAQKATPPTPLVSMQDLYNWATASYTYTQPGTYNDAVKPRDHRTGKPGASPLNLDIIITDWHITGSPQFNDISGAGVVPIIAAHPTFGTVTPNP